MRLRFTEIVAANTIELKYHNAVAGTEETDISFDYVMLPYPDEDKVIDYSFSMCTLKYRNGKYYTVGKHPKKLGNKQWKELYENVNRLVRVIEEETK